MSNNTEWETVVRIVYPTRDIDQVWPLYALDWTQPILSDAVLDPRIDMNPANIGGMNQSALQRVIRRGTRGENNRGPGNNIVGGGRAPQHHPERGGK